MVIIYYMMDNGRMMNKMVMVENIMMIQIIQDKLIIKIFLIQKKYGLLMKEHFKMIKDMVKELLNL